MTDAPRRVNVDNLRKAVSTFPDEIKDNDGRRTLGLANTVIAHFLGRDWLEAYVLHTAPRPSFLRMDFSSGDRRREATVFRVIELAESLYNLQIIEGFDACISQMKGGGEKIQSTCAELDFGRFLYIHDVKFRFVIPQMTKGSDYDVDLFYPDDLAVPADAKRKFETTEINPKSIVNSLEIGRKKLPADRPGIIFVKVPQRWILDVENAVAMVDAGREFLRNTDRIVAITFYVSHLETRDNVVMHRHALRELTNETSRFHQGRNWELFTNYYVPPSWNGIQIGSGYFSFPRVHKSSLSKRKSDANYLWNSTKRSPACAGVYILRMRGASGGDPLFSFAFAGFPLPCPQAF